MTVGRPTAIGVVAVALATTSCSIGFETSEPVSPAPPVVEPSADDTVEGGEAAPAIAEPDTAAPPGTGATVDTTTDDTTTDDTTTDDTTTGYGVEPGERISGTDAEAVEPAPLGPAVETRLELVAAAYLTYDHRLDPPTPLADHVDALTDDLAAQVTGPLPPAMTAELAAEQRVAVADVVSITSSGPSTYTVEADVTVDTVDPARPGEPPTSTTIRRRLLVTVDTDGLVSDIR